MPSRTSKERKCPECGRPAQWENNRFRPFCSSRCKQIDLGKWLNEEYSLPVLDMSPEDEGAFDSETTAQPDGYGNSSLH